MAQRWDGKKIEEMTIISKQRQATGNNDGVQEILHIEQHRETEDRLSLPFGNSLKCSFWRPSPCRLYVLCYRWKHCI